MGKVNTAYSYRIARATKLVLAGKVTKSVAGPYWWVESQTDSNVKYYVMVEVDQEEQPGEVVDTACFRYERVGVDGPFDRVGTGPDWQRQLDAMTDAHDLGYSPFNPGICQVNACPVCKHVLAAMLYAQIIPWPEDAPALTMELPVTISAAKVL